MPFDRLVESARKTINPRNLGKNTSSGTVAAAIETDRGNVYTGVCIDAPSGMGFCAEHAAIAAMITAGENRIARVVAVYHDGRVIPPCGRCREFIRQIHGDNLDCEVLLANRVATLRELLPDAW